jgi:hypothetical protein
VCLFLFVSRTAFAEDVSLSDLQATSSLSFVPGRDVAPRLENRNVAGLTTGKALRLVAEAEVTYTVPANHSMFSGVLIYDSDPKSYVPVMVRILDDGKPIWEQGLTGADPPLAFSIPVVPGSRLAIESESVWVTSFYLADARFSQAGSVKKTAYLPKTGEGYVDLAPLARQQVLNIYHPGETVPITAYFGGASSQAGVEIHFRPSWGAQSQNVSEVHLDIPLHASSAALSQGTTSWVVPSVQGPGMLHVKETIGGRVVFDRQLRVGVGPKVNLAAESDSLFGVHLSGGGYPVVFDHFADLWGAKWGRIFLRWPIVESSQGKLDFSRIDRLIEIYRSQNMKILMVLGENAPAWAGSPGPTYYTAWQQFTNAAVQHLAGKVDAWEIFNEVDAKYADALHKYEADWDIKSMRIAIDAVKAKDPRTPTVCCSTVTSSWLAYDRRVFQGGIIKDIDIVSLHPYQHGAPEEKDGEFNYRDRLAKLGDLERSLGANKPIWSTEDNWIIGQAGDRSVPEPDMNEQEQAEYVVRANLLSAASNVKFFLHSPYAHAHRTEIHVATWAAYGQMTSFFSGATGFKLVRDGPQFFSVAADTRGGQAGALWCAHGLTNARLEGGSSYRFFDFYGNPLNLNPDALNISAAPLYYHAQGNPELRTAENLRSPAWRALDGYSSWTCASNARCTTVPAGRQVQTQASTGAFQLVSRMFQVAGGACQLVHIQLTVNQGTVGFYAVDDSGNRLSQVLQVSAGDSQAHKVELRFRASVSGNFKLVLANSNTSASVSEFTALGTPEISDCP